MSAAFDHGYLSADKYIINHDIMNCTAEGVVGNHLYSGRALGMSEPWDIIQLHPDLKPLWCEITHHYQRIQLSHSKHVIWDLNLKQLGSNIGYRPSIFYFGPQECRYWGDSRWMETVDYINSKNNFISLAESLGVDVPQTHCYDSVEDIGSNQIRELEYPCYLKAAVSVSGVGIYRCNDETEFSQALSCFDSDVPVQVQEEVKTDRFLNLQYRILGHEVVRLAASEQILDGFTHQGNRVPASHEPWHVVEPMAVWLRDHGMQGVFAFDVAVTQTNRGLRFPVIECNPRYNGASYPTMIAQKLDIAEWRAVTLSTQYRSLTCLDLDGLEFNPRTGEGVIIVNWGTVLVGKLVFLIAGSPEVQNALQTALETRL